MQKVCFYSSVQPSQRFCAVLEALAHRVLYVYLKTTVDVNVQGGLPPTRHSSHGQNRYWMLSTDSNCSVFMCNLLSVTKAVVLLLCTCTN